MYVRVTTFPGLAPERIKATLQEFHDEHLPRLEQQPGYRGVFSAVDYPGGRAIAVTYWDSLEALHASDKVATEIRTAAVSAAGLDRSRPPITDNYEVVLDRWPASASSR
jgi:heme-degrading monooxygenase HmoA